MFPKLYNVIYFCENYFEEYSSPQKHQKQIVDYISILFIW